MKEIETINMTLGFVVHEKKVLLGLKKRGFGCGYWNGFGGKIQRGESPEECMKRELHEESSLRIVSMERRAGLTFYFTVGPIIRANVYLISEYTGIAKESDEMLPQWFEIQQIPYDKMWEDDRYWVPDFLAGKKITGEFWFDENQKMLDKKIILKDSFL